MDNTKITFYEKFDIVRRLLDESGFSLLDGAIRRFDAHLSMIHAHGRTFGVVSRSDIEKGAYQHTIDSLSLIPHIQPLLDSSCPLVDIGSGGGFPGLVCAAAFPDSEIVLIERSSKKCAFLRRCVAEMELQHVSILSDSFDVFPWDAGPVIGLTRGLERAEEMVPQLISKMAEGSVCFWMTGSGVEVDFAEGFHVEQIVDEWLKLGVRRGVLYRIQVCKEELGSA